MVGGLALLALGGFGGQRVLARLASTPSRPGPRCLPARLNGSALLPSTTLTVSPLPGSFDASPATQISLLGAPVQTLAGLSVRGSQTGAHTGRLEPYSQGDGANFVLSKPLRAGETVTVRGVQHKSKGASVRFAFSFTLAQRDRLPYVKRDPKPRAKTGDVQSFHSLSGVLAPAVKVLSFSPQQAAGDVFAAPYSGPGQDGPMIFDSTGQLVWFHPLPAGTVASNLQVDSYEGKPVLSWWQGYIPPQGFGQGEEIIADSSYRTLIHVHAGNGYPVDLHEFRITPQNTALFTVFNPIACDLSSVHGPSGGAVTDGVMQEVDLKTGLVRREWHSIDHVSPSQSYSSSSGSGLSWPWDYFHINSIERLHDGRLLVSSRNTSAVYELDPATQQVRLQIGGKHSSVKLGRGTSTAYQHDARQLPDGDLSIFDNGGVPMVHSQSRGLVLALDSKSRALRLVAQYEHNKPLKSASQGNMQLLENGDFFLGWGAAPYVSEYTPQGQVVFDARLPHAIQSYRSYRFPWSATPAEPPAIAIGKQAEGAAGMLVYASWNGATSVVSWRVLAGPSPEQLAPLIAVARSGFETRIEASGEPAYLAVQALDSSGAVLGTSKTIKR